MPPRFFSLGMPPANNPPSCGAADSMPPDGGPDPWSLLLLARPGVGGARPPGMGGASPTGGPPDDDDSLPTSGAERSLVTAFFRDLPFWISERRAFYVHLSATHESIGLNTRYAPCCLTLLAAVLTHHQARLQEAEEAAVEVPQHLEGAEEAEEEEVLA